MSAKNEQEIDLSAEEVLTEDELGKDTSESHEGGQTEVVI